MPAIYHLTSESEREANQGKEEYRADSLALEGFMHCSKDHPQVLAVANRLFPGRNDIVVWELDTGRIRSPLKHEPSRSGEVYPHIYGPLNTDAVTGVFTLSIGVDGRFDGMVPR